MEEVLYKNSWINYFDNFYLNYNIVEYPKNRIFVANILSEYFKKNESVYKKYSYAKKFDVSTLNNIDWKTANIIFDKNLKIIIAPEPLKKIINLMKTLDYEKAENKIFGGFKIPFISINSYGIIVFIMIIVFFIKICFYFDLFYRFTFL